MDKTALLERLYQTFAEEKTPHTFFIALTDYIDLIDTTPEFKAVIDELDGQRKAAEKSVRSLETPTLKALDAFHTKLVAYIRKNKIKDEEIEDALRDYELWQVGNARGSQTKCEALDNELSDIVCRLYYNFPEHKKYAEQHISFYDAEKTKINRIVDIPEVRAYEEALLVFKEKTKTEIWGEIHKLGWIYQAVKHGRERWKELQAKVKKENTFAKRMELLDFSTLYGEWDAIEREGKARYPFLFKVEETLFIVKRLHNYLLSHASFGKSVSVQKEPALLASPPAFSIPKSFSPRLCSEKGTGFIQIYKNTKKIRVGKIGSRKFKLIQCLFSPEDSISAEYEGVAQMAERVLAKIALPKDKENTKLRDLATKKAEVFNIIENVVKEVQKIDDLKGIASIEWLNNHQQLRLKIIPREGNT